MFFSFLCSVALYVCFSCQYQAGFCHYGPVVESELDIMVLVAVFSFPKVLKVFICLLVD